MPAIILIVLLTACNKLQGPFYEPVITFKGYVGDEWLELPGHAGMPNTCKLRGDTVEIWCYSRDYEHIPTNLRHGYAMRIDIRPFTIDTNEDFVTSHVLTRFTDYAVGTSELSYIVAPKDTAYATLYAIKGDVISLNRRPEASVHIEKIQIPYHQVGKSGVVLRVQDGVLKGEIERF
jgi:hypothetical protein